MRELLLFAVLFPVLTQAQVYSPSAVSPSGESSVTISAPDFRPTQRDVYIYVDPTNGLDSNPGIQGSPVKTLSAAAALLPVTYTGKCRIMLAAGSYSVTTLTMRAGTSVGTKAGACVLIGPALTDSGLGTRTVSSVGATSPGNVYQITDNTLTPTLDQYVGYYLRMTTGVAAGYTRLVRGNTVGGQFEWLTPDGGATKRPVVGDHFVLEKPSATVTISSNLILTGPSWASYGVKFVMSGGYMKVNTSTVMYALLSEWDLTTNGTLMFSSYSQFNGGVQALLVDDDLFVNAAVSGSGVYIHSSANLPWGVETAGPGVMISGNFLFRGPGGLGLRLLGPGAFVSMYAVDAKGCYLDIGPVSDFRHVGAGGLKGRIYSSSTFGLRISLASSCEKMMDLDLSNNAGHGIDLEDKSVLSDQGGIIGTGNGGAGIAVLRGSGLSKSVANTTTITGAVGELLVGTTVGTHANVWNGTPITDAVGGFATK